MATQVTPNLGAVGSKRPYRVIRVPLQPHQQAEDEINAIAAEGYAVKSMTGDGQAMILLFELNK